MLLEDKYNRLKIEGGMETLKTNYPFPKKEPKASANDFGWFSEDVHIVAFEKLVPKDAKLVLEIGSWFGKSSRWFLDHASNADIICIDTWLGALEQHTEKTCFAALPTLYDTFIKNMWQYRDRVVPLRVTSDVGLQIVKMYGVEPDVIYIDGAHDYLSVFQDFDAALRLFPNALILGDDFQYDQVCKAVSEVSDWHDVLVDVNIGSLDNGVQQACWWVDKKD